MSCKLSLIVPCYNEEATLKDIVDRILQIGNDEVQLEIVIVDDCSRDSSLSVARALEQSHEEVKVFHHEVNQGKGAALRTGFLQASGDYIGVQDADMEYEPADYHILLKPMLEGKADVVFGSRYLRPDTRRVLYYWHTWMNKTLTRCSNMFTNLDITDMETCYKLFRREILHQIAPRLKENRFGFEPEVTSYIAETHCRVYECAIHYHPRSYEEGKKIGWKDGLRALYCIMHYGACNAPVPMQLLIYLIIGTVAAIANLIFFGIGISLELPFLYAIGGAYVLAAMVNYYLCILILFRHKARWNSVMELGMYVFTFTAMGMLDYGVTRGLFALGLGIMWSKACSSVVGFFGNYLMRRCLVFPMRNKWAPPASE